MKIGLQTWGSEGDIRPFAALAQGLAARGHQVRLVYTSVDAREYPEFEQRGGFTARAIGTRYFLDHQDEHARGVEALFRSRSVIGQVGMIVRKLYDPVVDAMYDAALELANDTDLVVHHPLDHAAATAAEKLHRPRVVVSPVPAVPTRWLPPAGMPDLGILNGLLWRVAKHVVDGLFLERVNELRAREGVPLLRDIFDHGLARSHLVLIAASPTLFDRPRDWSDAVQVPGFFDFETPITPDPPEELTRFIDAGPAPVFAGFGSMVSLDSTIVRASIDLLIESVRLAGVRAIVQVPPALLAERAPPDGVMFVARVRHAAVFPRCAAVVHHAGAGTTHAAAAAGVPAVVVPHLGDQFFWAAALHRVGVAPRPIARRSVTAKSLARRIREATQSAAMRERAAEVGAKIRAERGVDRAAALIEALGEETG